NRMDALVLSSAKDVVPQLREWMPKGASVGAGGSMTLEQCGVMAFLREGGHTFFDRDAEGADVEEVFRRSFSADFYLASANAVTEQGEIYEIDGRGNRVAAIAFGPKNVILVAGFNKIVEGIDEARMRNFTVAAPANSHRLGLKTPCAVTGECSDCDSPQRICCTELVLGPQRVPGRVKVLLVCEDLGY
ncbi:lactate utilization protein, partial [Ruminococcaceae bacterium OttesenSCG-928-I18]|nr:lactate utilization protein [Ruminococcaceae bacterium OttesenSCG-928-I18]